MFLYPPQQPPCANSTPTTLIEKVAPRVPIKSFITLKLTNFLNGLKIGLVTEVIEE